ncbi:TonB-dependent receptor [Sphingomonas metalli]|uniref:TonB-dependent receptor n=1 Tax=Sphingomonas metalli TaxID=1779358 RepID=A0A916WTE0_9SPHN|nr:TonB-dependent receptor [Sphingomonas metalli]GGB31095.1 TonB-dependent receptor [Sphingomonas metalli]
MKRTAVSRASWSSKALFLTSSALTLVTCPSLAAAQVEAPVADQAIAGQTPAEQTITEQKPIEQAAADDQSVSDRDIVVTGIRAALDSAKETKRKASTFVDSITASDIATLPDLSVAEAIGRIPGVTISRFPTGGASPDFPSPEGRGNLVRGLGFVRSEFNGRDAFSANGGRSLDFSSIPPELVGGVDVYKNQTADLIEGGIGGTINLRTLEPFDAKKDLFVVALDGTYSDLRKKWAPEASITTGKRWNTGIGEIGILGSFSRSRLDSRINGWQQSQPIPRVLDANGNVPEINNLNDLPRPNEFVGVDPSRIVGITPGFQLRTNDVNRLRTSYYGALQWKKDGIQATFKYIRVDTKIDSLERTLEWFPDHNGGVNIGVQNLALDKNWGSSGLPMCSGPGGQPTAPGDCETLYPVRGGLMESGLVTSNQDSWTGARGRDVGMLGIGKIEESKTQDFSLNLKWNATDRLYATFDGQYTKASARQRQIWGGMNSYFNYSIDQDLDHPRVEFFIDPTTRFNPSNTRYTGDRDPVTNAQGVVTAPGIYIPTPTSSGDFNGANFQYAADQFQNGDGDLYALRTDLAYDVSGGDGLASWFDSVKFGARYSERSQVNSEMALNWGAIAPAWAGGYGIAGTFQDPNRGFEAVSFKNFFRGDGVVQGNNTDFVFVNHNILNNYADFRNYIASEPQLATLGSWVPRGTNDGTAFGRANYNPEDTSNITERTKNAYVRLDFKQSFDNGMSVDGNFGVRYVRTDLRSTGFQAFRPFNPDLPSCSPTGGANQTNCQYTFDPTTGRRLRTDDAESRDDIRDFAPGAVAYASQAAIPTALKLTDEHWLPSFNVKWNLDREMLVRFGYSKGLSRPNVQDLRASQEFVVTTQRTNFQQITDTTDPLFGVDRGAQNITASEVRVSRGNPYLKPTTADSFDLSYEYYFKSGYLSVAGFYKSLKNIITNGDLPLGTVTLDGKTLNVIYSGPVNQAKAKVKGIEIAYQQFFEFLPGPLKHLGFQGNYTFIDASTTPPGNGADANGDGIPDDLTQVFRWGVSDLLGQSKHIANAVAIYQDRVVEARLAYNWRSQYLTTYRDYVTGNPIYNSAAGFLDASLKFNFGQWQLRGSIANILDTKSKARALIDSDGQMYDRFSFLNDRRIVVGALFRL